MLLQSIGTTELLIIAGILLVMFGSSKLPQLAKGISDSVREFKKASAD
ncbi:MAG: Sec-independent protein translocase protein TatA [Candidatus Amesbacteria bacterium GW2011_GWA2_47_11b]|uniref:Sec-independent protein translocase protein TatA n=2 Tax=Candidatus Amesiibacteriota TaxID=1752730 RepID=A0A0G1UR88_9BACT|nr:MAG: Sec-independent protein translocase protein TatA [Microgenomates group bacterium GW2011_GWC1_46_20]KKU57397.1 MAG: Sec-independent protein translocase protein TatA [Candidatus Amesbacteria bacterium GW2011_GWA2_47_11b]KKU68568.1 MAG: Sec-independent protein translocase protein TatA [Candidatus Amesbacteria bacterium GW2011_GWA1_47_20]